jgi:uncharacterized protein (TIGR00251 family)
MVETESVRLAVKVQPNAGRNELLRFQDGVLHIRVAAPPTKGKANKELIEFLSGILGVGRGYLKISKGMTSQRKVIDIDGLTRSQVMGRLEKLVM